MSEIRQAGNESPAYAPPALRRVALRARWETLGLTYPGYDSGCSAHAHSNGDAQCAPPVNLT